MPRPIPIGRLRAQARLTPHPRAEQTAEFYRRVAAHRAQQFTCNPETDGPRGLAAHGRPGDMAEVSEILVDKDWDFAVGSFLDEFRANPNQPALDVAPPPEVQGYYRAFLAAVAETIAHERGWEVPAWTEDPSTFLPGAYVPSLEEWDAHEPVTEAEISRKARGTTPIEFRRRGITVGANVLTRF